LTVYVTVSFSVGYCATGYNSSVPFLAVCRVSLHKTHLTPASLRILLTICLIGKNCDEMSRNTSVHKLICYTIYGRTSIFGRNASCSLRHCIETDSGLTRPAVQFSSWKQRGRSVLLATRIWCLP